MMEWPMLKKNRILNNLFSLLIILFSLSCALNAQENQGPLGQYSIAPGEVRWIEFSVNTDDAKLICRGSEVKYVKKNKKGYAFIIESYFSDLSSFHCNVTENEKIIQKISFSVIDKPYKAEKLKVDPKKIKLAPDDEMRVAKEQVVLNKIYKSSIPDFLFTESFGQPMDSLITSVYGTKRVYNKQKKGQHLGIDFRAAIGDKVPAANAGKIVFSGDLFYTGWTVIIDHGLDIFTVYGHLSKTLVSDGDIVKKGDLIGLSGNTGRTSGPHLHWGTKIQGQYIDGQVLIEESKKYFK